jgi:Glycosyl transferases group 1
VRLTHIHRVHTACAAHGPLRRSAGDPIRFGYLGAHSPEKGIELLLDAFAGLANTTATLTCHGGGGAAYLAQLKRRASAHPGIAFHGSYEQGQLSSILRNIDIGIVPSICEDTAPNTVLEFQAAGIPVIGSHIGGIPEQIDDGRNGALFEAGNKTALRKCMQRVMDDPKIISEWAANLPSSFDPRPSWLRIENVLGELAASDHAALVSRASPRNCGPTPFRLRRNERIKGLSAHLYRVQISNDRCDIFGLEHEFGHVGMAYRNSFCQRFSEAFDRVFARKQSKRRGLRARAATRAAHS